VGVNKSEKDGCRKKDEKSNLVGTRGQEPIADDFKREGGKGGVEERKRKILRQLLNHTRGSSDPEKKK